MVGDYISRVAALTVLDWDCASQDALNAIKAIPAADVAPVKHASWIEDGYYNEACVCSNCGEPCKDTVMGKPRWNYCPNCGARCDL